jgi:phosphohistidine phosphatase
MAEPIDLYLIRHAAAVPAAAPPETGRAISDEARPLTDEGRARFARVVRGLDRIRVRFDLLRHSPWTRAVETADLLVPLCRGETVADPLLCRPPDRALVASLRGSARVGLVGHQPWLGELLALLVIGSARRADAFDWRKGGVAWLTGEPRAGAMQLRAFLPPRIARRV